MLKYSTASAQVNYLSALYLTLELLPNILEASSSPTSGDARIIFTASSFHRSASWNPENFNPVEEGYHRLWTYSQTKMYNVRNNVLVKVCIIDSLRMI